MYKKILVPYDKSEPAQHALSAALDLAAGVPDAQITVLSVVDWHDFNAETFKIASRMSGVMGDTMDMDVMAEVEKATHLIADLFDYYAAHIDEVPADYRAISDGDDLRAVTDYIAGMTDRYATHQFNRIFIPSTHHDG